jgi:hypothetical protein
VALASGGAGAAIGVCFRPVEGAARHRVEIAKDAAFADVVDAGEVGPEADRWAGKPLYPGRYYARVLGLDAEGVAGEASRARSVGVVRAEVPSSTVRGARTLVGADGETVALLDAADFEVAVDGGPWAPPPSPLAVKAQPRSFRIRCKGDPSSETEYAIERRTLRADVKLTPTLPRWPGDAIDVTVTLVDPTGRTDAAAFVPRLSVVLGLEALPVAWTHEGAAYRARVAAMAGRAPAVLRAIATDANGVELGRGFVEIDKR